MKVENQTKTRAWEDSSLCPETSIKMLFKNPSLFWIPHLLYILLRYIVSFFTVQPSLFLHPSFLSFLVHTFGYFFVSSYFVSSSLVHSPVHPPFHPPQFILRFIFPSSSSVLSFLVHPPFHFLQLIILFIFPSSSSVSSSPVHPPFHLPQFILFHLPQFILRFIFPSSSSVSSSPVHPPFHPPQFILRFIFPSSSSVSSTLAISSFYLHLLTHLSSSLTYTVKKVSGFPVPSRDVTNQAVPRRLYFPALQ